MKSLFVSWKTTLGGLGILLATLGNAIGQYASGGFAAVNLTTLIAGLSAAFAAFAAKDFNVTGGTTVQPSPPPAP